MKQLVVILLVLMCIVSPAFGRYEAMPNIDRQLKRPAKMPDFKETIAAFQAAAWAVEDAVEAGKGAYWRWLYGPRPPPR